MASPFASEHTETHPLPFDPPHTITIHKITGVDLERAQFEHLASIIGGRSARNWAPRYRRILTEGVARDQDVMAALRDPLLGYDRFTVARAGLESWSYTITVDGKTQPKPITDAAVRDLVDEALEFFALKVMRLTKPQLFLSEEEVEEARKNDSGASIAI